MRRSARQTSRSRSSRSRGPAESVGRPSCRMDACCHGAARPPQGRGADGRLSTGLGPAAVDARGTRWAARRSRSIGLRIEGLVYGAMRSTGPAAPTTRQSLEPVGGGRVARVKTYKSSSIRRRRSICGTHFGCRLVLPRRDALRHIGERADTEGRMQAQRMDGLPARSRASTPTDRSRRTTRLSAGGCAAEIWSIATATSRGRLSTPRPAIVWRSSTAPAAAMRSTSPAQAGLGWRPSLTYRVPR